MLQLELRLRHLPPPSWAKRSVPSIFPSWATAGLARIHGDVMDGPVHRATSVQEPDRRRDNSPTDRQPLASRSGPARPSNPSRPGRVDRNLPKPLGQAPPSNLRLLAPVLPPIRTAPAVLDRVATARIAPGTARIAPGVRDKVAAPATARTATVAVRDTPVRVVAQGHRNARLGQRNPCSTSTLPSSSCARPSWSASWRKSWDGSLSRSLLT